MAVYKVTFLPMNVTVEVDPAKFPLQEDGLPGSILDIALGNNIDLQHNCGGKCACTTCHVIVRDRKSTRLNSSHVRISYAVFCLKKTDAHDSRFARYLHRSPWQASAVKSIVSGLS